MATPTAYIRRSVASASDPGDSSREFQSEKVRALAGAEGAALRIIDCDWGKSAGRDKTEERPGFIELLAAIGRGEVSTLYAYSADRLARSVRWSAQLLDTCERAGTVIVTGEGRFDPTADRAAYAMARQMFHFRAMQNEGVLDQMTDKNQAAADAQKAHAVACTLLGRPHVGRCTPLCVGHCTQAHERGRKSFGEDPDRHGEDVNVILHAYKEAKSGLGAAKLLNSQGVPTRLGKAWDPATVLRIVR